MTDLPSSARAATPAGHLAELNALGGYFALPTDPVPQSRCLTEFFDEDVLASHIGRTRDAMAASADCSSDRIPIRTAASSFHLGVAARLLSPVIGGALCSGGVPVLDNRSVRWVPTDGHAPQFAVPDPTWEVVTSDTSAQVITASVIPVLTELGTRLNAVVSLSPRITLGNLTSAANGAVTVLALSRPQLETAGRALVRALLRSEPLSATGAFVGGRFRRNSCCLYYQAPRSGLCGDCVLVPDATP